MLRAKNNALSAYCNRIPRICAIYFARCHAALRSDEEMTGRKNDFTRRLLAWYDRSRRDLPWRVPPGSPVEACPDPYHVLVS